MKKVTLACASFRVSSIALDRENEEKTIIKSDEVQRTHSKDGGYHDISSLNRQFFFYMVASEGPSEYVRAIWPGVWQEVKKSAQVTGPVAGDGGASSAADANKGKTG